MGRPFRDISGQAIERLTALQYLGGGKWLRRCSYGKTKVAAMKILRDGQIKSCGCVKRRPYPPAIRTQHPAEYWAWKRMRAACHVTSDPDYWQYGGRGIEVCKRWRRSFDAYIADPGPKPTAAHRLSHCDKRKGLSPSNCQWVKKRKTGN